jgi:hypothetical protein
MAHMWHVRGERWESIPHRVLRDKRLTFRARGLLCYLLSLPDDWQTSVHRLRDLTPAKEPGRPYEGREALESAVHELEGCGYLYRWPRRNERGHASGYVWAYSADVETLRATLEEVAPEVVQRAAVSGSPVDGSPGDGADQPKQGEPAGRPVSGSTGDGSHANLRRTVRKKNEKKNEPSAPHGRSAVAPECGQCDARPGDPVSARVVWLDEDRTLSTPCPRCAPQRSGGAR